MSDSSDVKKSVSFDWSSQLEMVVSGSKMSVRLSRCRLKLGLG